MGREEGEMTEEQKKRLSRFFLRMKGLRAICGQYSLSKSICSSCNLLTKSCLNFLKRG